MIVDLRLYEVADRDKVELAHEFLSGKHVELSPTADGKICLSSMIYLLLIAAKLPATGRYGPRTQVPDQWSLQFPCPA